MVRAAGESTPYRLEFRSSPVIGANAFALPAGIIVLTDELVRLSRSDNEALGVLAHELGHVRYRHTMRRLLEGSATALVIAGVTGDIASTTSLAAAAPTLLLQTRYSRDNEREADRYAVEMMRKSGIEPRHLGAILARLESDSEQGGMLPTFLSSHPPTEERRAFSGAGAADTGEESDPSAEEVAEFAAIPERPRLVAVDPVQRQVIGLLEKRDYGELERLLGGFQAAFEADPGTNARLENAFAAFRKVPRSTDAALSDWIRKYPSSYVARVARGSFYTAQGLDARGSGFMKDTPEGNIRTMHAYLGKARADLDRSLKLTQKPYLSRLILMSIARSAGPRRSVRAHYLEAVKLAPQSVELRLAYMSSLEPRWGGNLKQMEAFAAESRSQLVDSAAADRLAARLPAYRARDRQRAKDYTQALRLYDEAVALHPAASTLCERSWVLSQLNRDAEAFADVKLALSRARDIRYCLRRAVAVASHAPSVEEAIAMMNLVIEVETNSSHAFNQRGWRYQQAGKPDLAFRDFLASARLGDAWGQLMAGKSLWAGRGVKEDREEALAWLRKAAEQGNRDARLSLEQALQQVGQHTR